MWGWLNQKDQSSPVLGGSKVSPEDGVEQQLHSPVKRQSIIFLGIQGASELGRATISVMI